MPRTLLRGEKFIEDTVECCGSLSTHYWEADTIFETVLSSAGNVMIL